MTDEPQRDKSLKYTPAGFIECPLCLRGEPCSTNERLKEGVCNHEWFEVYGIPFVECVLNAEQFNEANRTHLRRVPLTFLRSG